MKAHDNLILLATLEELQRIAATADAERLSVWRDQFRIEYPTAAETIEKALNQPTAAGLIAWLGSEFPALSIARRILGREWSDKLDRSIEYLHVNFHQETPHDNE
jgi:hypothetical protein